jgi:hypothetical protein
VTLQREAEALGDIVLESLDLVVFKFDDRTADVANAVVVVLRNVFVEGLAVSEMSLLDQSGLA